MRILHISTQDSDHGAARAAYRLHLGLRELGEDSSMLVAQRRSHDPNVRELVRSRRWSSRLPRLARRFAIQRSFARYESSRPPEAQCFNNDGRSEYGSAVVQQLPACDLVNLQAIPGLVDYRSFFRSVPRRIPVVWTLHDPSAFTGGCHYPAPCVRFNHGCGACPELGSADRNDLSRKIWRRKKESYSFVPGGRLHLVAPSRWLAGEVRQSALLGGFPVSVIANGLDTSTFSPRDKGMAREILAIKRDSNVVLFAADAVQDPRKGFKLLVEALAPWPAGKHVDLVSVGRGSDFPGLQLPHKSLGHIENDRILSWVYSAADVYVTPTLHDNLPCTVMESMACATPVVGFEVGGVPEMVRNGVSGFVVPKGDTGALRQAILRVLDNPALKAQMAENCRRIALEEYDVKLQARRYLTLYQSLVSPGQPSQEAGTA